MEMKTKVIIRAIMLSVWVAIPNINSAQTRIAWLTNMGGASDIRVDTSRQLAYMATQAGCMAVVDVQDPSAPWLRGWAKDGCSGWKVDQQDVVVAVAAPSGGAHIYDVSNPAMPVRTGHLPGSVRNVAVLGGRVYITDFSGTALLFRTLSLSGTILGSANLGNIDVTDMTSCGGQIHMITRTGRVIAMNVASDAAPTIADDWTLPDSVSTTQIACDSASGVPYIGRFRSTSTGNQTVLSTKAKPLLLVNPRSVNNALWIADGWVYGYGSALGRIPFGTWGPAEEISGPVASAVVGSGNLLYTAYGTISTTQQRGGLQIFSFGGSVPTPVPPVASATGTVTATATRTPTTAVVAHPTCPSGCVVP